MNDKSQNLTSEKKNLYLEYALFLILGFLLGVVIKTEAAKRITIGYNDYQVAGVNQVYNINKIQKSLMEEKQEQDQKNPNNQPAAEGAETSQ